MKERQLEFEDLLIRKAMELEVKEEPLPEEAEPAESAPRGFRFLNALRRLGRGPQLSRERETARPSKE